MKEILSFQEVTKLKVGFINGPVTVKLKKKHNATEVSYETVKWLGRTYVKVMVDNKNLYYARL